MINFGILAAGLFLNLIAIFFVIVAVALILIILIQKGRGTGLSGAFGGSMAGSILGSKTGDFLTWVTIALVSVFLFFAVVLAKFYKPTVGNYDSGEPVRSSMPQGQQQVPADNSTQEETGTTSQEDMNTGSE